MPAKKQRVEQEVYSSVEACEYLGIDFDTFRYHVYKKKHLIPDQKVGHNLAFRRSTLDAFRAKHKADGYSIQEAADYMGVDLSWVRHHVFNTKELVPDAKHGRKFIFSKETLDAFKSVFLKDKQPA